MLTNSRKAQLGLNLVELMIGLVVGMIVLAAMTTVYLNTARGSRDTLNANRLNQDLRAVMDIMVSDIRRAGYWGTADAGNTNCFALRTPRTANPTNCAAAPVNLPQDVATDIYISDSNRCILYSYDGTYRDGDTTGTPSTAGADSFGFRLSGNAVQMLNASSRIDTDQACTSVATWNNLTDSSVIRISALTFITSSPGAGQQGSQCLNADTGATWTAAASSAAACADTTAAGYVAPGAGNRLAETRQITISITANHVSDTSLQRTLTESVLVRNNRLCTSGTNC
jgi:prepilin peptidase dependent protein B